MPPSVAKKRSPLLQFRQRGTNYKPLYEMFLCYGMEEFFECRDDRNFSVPLNFSDMLEQRAQKSQQNEHYEARRATLAAQGKEGGKSADLLGVDNIVNDRLGDNLMDQSCFNIGETCIRDSRMDNIAEQYAQTLTPDALMQ